MKAVRVGEFGLEGWPAFGLVVASRGFRKGNRKVVPLGRFESDAPDTRTLGIRWALPYCDRRDENDDSVA